MKIPISAGIMKSTLPLFILILAKVVFLKNLISLDMSLSPCSQLSVISLYSYSAPFPINNVFII